MFHLAADRRHSDAWRTQRENEYPIYEFMSSRLTNVHSHRVLPEAIISYGGNAYGRVTFDTTQDAPSVRYDIVDTEGKV